MVPAPIITASTLVRRQTRNSVSVALPIGPERPWRVALPSTVRAKFVTTYGRSVGALEIRSSWWTSSTTAVEPGSGYRRRIEVVSTPALVLVIVAFGSGTMQHQYSRCQLTHASYQRGGMLSNRESASGDAQRIEIAT